MSLLHQRQSSHLSDLAELGYWVALAARALEEKQFARAIEMCRQNLANEPHLIGPRIIYAKALLATRQQESALEQCHLGLSVEPDNEVLLKLLGDVLVEQGNIVEGVACFQRILEINPHCRGLHSPIKTAPRTNERYVTFVRGEEIADREKKISSPVLYYTETIGDLYLTQGHPRMAVEVFRKLLSQSDTPRLRQKLTVAEERMRNKDDTHVSSAD